MATAQSIKAALALTKREAAFGTAIADAALLDMVKMKDIDFAKVKREYRTDEDEITGFGGPTEHEVVKRTGTFGRKFNASVETLAAFIIWQLSRLTTTGTGPFTHTVRWPQICTLNPFSLSLIEGLDCPGSSATFLLYKGIVVEQTVIEIDGNNPVQFTVSFKTDGSETAKASFTFPASYAAVNRLLGSMLTLKLGPALENVTSIFRKLKITTSAGIVEPPSAAAGVHVAEYQYGEQKPDLAIEVTLKGDKSHALYNFDGNVKFQMLLQKAAGLSAQLDCSQGVVEAEQEKEGRETRLNITYMPEWNATEDGPGKWTFVNGVAAYLVAA